MTEPTVFVDNGSEEMGCVEVNVNDLFKEISEESKIMQSTGLTDKNGKEIFEGDILEWDFSDQELPDAKEYLTVEWNYFEACFYGVMGDEQEPLAGTLEQTTQPEIIGNIYENPELLK